MDLLPKQLVVDHLDTHWTPPGRESREDWLATHGAVKTVYEETFALVKQCKVMMLRRKGHKVSANTDAHSLREYSKSTTLYVLATSTHIRRIKQCPSYYAKTVRSKYHHCALPGTRPYS